MLYKFLRSKKGFTLTELMIVVTILGILTAVAIPLFSGLLRKQRQNDCENQRVVIEAVVKQAMAGLLDNGKKQPKINFEKLTLNQECCLYPGDGVTGNGDDTYVYKKCFILWNAHVDNVIDSEGTQHTIKQDPFTVSALRGGYRDTSITSYNEGCDAGYYLKKKYLEEDKVPLYIFLDNEEIPVCPFVENYNAQNEPEYFYYVFEDGTVLCSCPHCNEVD